MTVAASIFQFGFASISDRKTLELFTFIRKVAADAATVALRLNELNSNFALGQFHHLDDAIYSRHGVSFDGGLLPRQFVKIVRRFSGSFREAIERCGTCWWVMRVARTHHDELSNRPILTCDCATAPCRFFDD